MQTCTFLVAAAVAADTLKPSAGSRGRGMPVYKRRKAQVQAVQACWSVVFEGLTAISDVQLRKWWPWATKAAPGRESQFLVRLLLEVGHRDIQAPTGYVSQCLHVRTGMPYTSKRQALTQYLAKHGLKETSERSPVPVTLTGEAR